MHIDIVDKENGTLADGTVYKFGHRYYVSNIDAKTYSIPVDALERPDDRWEYDYKKGWYLPENKISLSDELW